jgi:hypothetical protein
MSADRICTNCRLNPSFKLQEKNLCWDCSTNLKLLTSYLINRRQLLIAIDNISYRVSYTLSKMAPRLERGDKIVYISNRIYIGIVTGVSYMQKNTWVQPITNKFINPSLPIIPKVEQLIDFLCIIGRLTHES